MTGEEIDGDGGLMTLPRWLAALRRLFSLCVPKT
jgi:hypothetical protein